MVHSNVGHCGEAHDICRNGLPFRLPGKVPIENSSTSVEHPKINLAQFLGKRAQVHARLFRFIDVNHLCKHLIAETGNQLLEIL